MNIMRVGYSIHNCNFSITLMHQTIGFPVEFTALVDVVSTRRLSYGPEVFTNESISDPLHPDISWDDYPKNLILLETHSGHIKTLSPQLHQWESGWNVVKWRDNNISMVHRLVLFFFLSKIQFLTFFVLLILGRKPRHYLPNMSSDISNAAVTLDFVLMKHKLTYNTPNM